MKPHIVSLRTPVAHSSETVFSWYMRPSAFERLIPPWEKVKILSKEGGPDVVGSQVVLKVRMGGWRRFVLQHREFIEKESFTDVQYDGPFKLWKHIHRVHRVDDNSCEIEDEIHFIPPLSFLKSYVKKKLIRMLHWRHETLVQDLHVQAQYPSSSQRILVSGSSGFIGSSLIPFLRTSGHEVFRLVRRRRDMREDTVYWDPRAGDIQIEDFENFDVIIHLAGKNLASARWTKRLKEEIFQSRCVDTQLLAQTISRVSNRPKAFLCASAIGIYGNRGDEELTEKSPFGEGFLATVCQKWEEASSRVKDHGVRRVNTRFGLVLSSKGGALARLLPLFRLGLGASIGSGKQWVSYIGLDDVVYGLYHCMMNEQIEGGVNFASPYPESNQAFSRKLAKALGSPLLFRIGEKFMDQFMGEMAKETVLSSTKIKPEKLLLSGYDFFCPKLEDVFRRQLF